MPSWIQKHKNKLLLPTIGLFLLIIIQNPFSKDPVTPLAGQIELIPNSIPTPTVSNEISKEHVQENTTASKEQSTVVVDIKGQVVSPGVYTLPVESRIIDAIALAGGLLPNADGRVLNLASKLTDEMVIYVPEVGEVAPVIESIPSQQEETTEGQSLVNINIADETQLMTLSGIGPSKAKAILAYRNEHGQFNTIEDLKSVTGIGDRTFENLKDFISVN